MTSGKPDFGLYNDYYGHLDDEAPLAVRRETYDEDVGQSSWITLAEAREWFSLLELGEGKHVLEVACGSGGMTCRMAQDTGAAATGVDINDNGIEAAKAKARELGLSSRVEFQVVDAGRRLPFPDGSFDAVFCNDAINHLPGRVEVVDDWHRVLRPGGRLLFTDPVVVTGEVTDEELRLRSSIGFFLFTPVGYNERALARVGFTVRETRDVTDATATISRKWRDARAKRREALVRIEGEEAFEHLQRFLDAVHTLSSERRLSRFMYLATRA
jgi:SAM-dependent methyltransferase